MTGARRIVGDLDAEAELAALALGRPRATLPRPVRAAIAGAATLLRVFARDGDRLWTPQPVAPERVVEVPGLPRVVLESGPPGALPAVVEQWPWMETPSFPRRGCDPPGGPSGPSGPSGPGVVGRVADRAWGLDRSRRAGFALERAVAVSSVPELAAAVAALGGRPWVLKAAFSAAGRDRLRDEAGAVRFLARHGRGVLEPWLERQADFGAVGEVGVRGVELVGLHRLRVDDGGRFRGLELTVGEPEKAPGLEPSEEPRLRAAFAAAGAALAAEGYRGPFGIDAFRFRRGRTTGGPSEFHPWVELNPRWTFGRVARGLVDRLADSHEWGPGAVVRFELGRAVPAGATLLLRPGAAGSAGSAGAWLERVG